MHKPVLAVDVGGSKYMVALVTRAGEVLSPLREMWNPHSGDEVMQTLLRAAERLLRQNPGVTPGSIGVTIPGLADPDEGRWIEASFSGIGDLPVARMFSERFGLPAFADNDGQACVLAEKFFGLAASCDDFLYLTVSNGVGGGAFSGGRLLRGGFSRAFEIGHCTLIEDGRLCKCGNRGCVETYASGVGLSQTYFELSGKRADGQRLSALAAEGDPDALRAWALEGEYLGRAIAYAANLLNPRLAILGGGLSLAFPLYEQALLSALQRHLYRRATPELTVRPTTLGYNGGLLGAAAVTICKTEGLYYE